MCGTLYVNVDWLFESSAQRGSAYMSTIDAALLGEAIVLCNGNAVNLPYKKAYALLYYIIIKRKHRLTRAHREKP